VDGGDERMITREWAMPNANTFSIPPIAWFVERWLAGAKVVVDPFARNSKRGTHTNDLNPETDAEYHMDAADFCLEMYKQGIQADAVLFDPPYSPRQISEVYQAIGRAATTHDTQNASLYRSVRDAVDPLLKPGGVALSFGWNSCGFGRERSYRIEEILIVAHGGAHNDTICVAERKLQGGLL
jgi:hypothetical protein